MVLSNIEILRCIEAGLFNIAPLADKDPVKPPFNTSAIDLRLADEVLVPEAGTPAALDLTTAAGISQYWSMHSKKHTITPEQPFNLPPNKLVLARTLETVDFPINPEKSYCARVEGKSSLARCGILIHFTAPTIHAGFTGTITLEIINLGTHKFLLTPGMYICQLIVEEVSGCPVITPSKFRGQKTAAGNKA